MKILKIYLCYVLKELLQEKLKNLTIKEFKKLYDKVTAKNKCFIFRRILLCCYGKEFQKTRGALLDLIYKKNNFCFVILHFKFKYIE
jgi:hypothetical protein